MPVEFARNKFRTFFEISLWLNLFGCAVGGIIIGYGHDSRLLGFGFLVLIVGVLLGLLSTVLFGGLVAIFLNIDKNLEIKKPSSSSINRLN